MEISSRQELSGALRSPDATLRQSLLQELAETFSEALAHGQQINPEVLEELYQCYSEGGIDTTWHAYLLLRIENPFSMEVARKEFVTSRHVKILLLAASHIARLPATERIEFLGPLVLDASNAVRCRAAANLLDDCVADLPLALALRTALISDHDLPLPQLNAGTIDYWLQELHGPYPDSTKKLLLQAGDSSLEFLFGCWAKLPTDIRVWVLRNACQRRIAAIRPLLQQILREEGEGEILCAALACMKTLGLDDEAVDALCSHHDAHVRAAAIALAKPGDDWPQRFAGEDSEAVRLAMLDQIIRTGETAYLPFLMACLQDPGWRVRARATDALVNLGSTSLNSLTAALTGNDDRVRVAAAQGLYRLGREDLVLSAALAASRN